MKDLKPRIKKLEVLAGLGVPEFIVVYSWNDVETGLFYEVPGKEEPLDPEAFKEWRADRGKDEVIILVSWE